MLAMLLIAGGLAQTPAPGPDATPLLAIPGGTYRPLYPADPDQPVATVGAFRLEAHPVTVRQFRAFVDAHPSWAPGKVPTILANASYLQGWAEGTPAPNQPATEVSWFAAEAYCASLGRRLPTEHEWELVARASLTDRDASEDPIWLAEVLAWYGEPSGAPLAEVASTPPNAWGVHDMQGLVWEWVEDFNSTLVAADARESGDGERLRFCGSGAVSAQDVRDYANFMRVAWRSALAGNTTTKNLGFRCAANAEAP